MFNEQENMDYIPLRLIPLYIIDKEKSNLPFIIEKENELLIND